MSILRKLGTRLILYISIFFVIWLMCILVAGRWVFSYESLLRGWLDGIKFFRVLGLFEYSSDEDLDDAVVNSLACFWFPFSAWLAWRLNHFFKSRTNGLTGVKP